MEKEKFDNYNGLLFCESCQKMVPKAHMNHRRVKPNYKISKCNVDMWLDRHKDFILLDGFTLEETKTALHSFLYDDECILNDVAVTLNKSLDDIIRLYYYLNIKGKHIKIRTSCTKCGKTIYKFSREYLIAENNYCSPKCYALDKTEKMHGENNPNYRRIDTHCSSCGKPIKVIPFDFDKHNSYGDNHNFCSQQCYWDFRSQYYIKEKTHFYHHVYTSEERENMRQALLRRLESSNCLNTTPQQIIDDILQSLSIEYQREKTFDYYAVDSYLTQEQGIIEVMGDYWHSNPLLYGEKRSMNLIQQKQIQRDKMKSSYITHHYQIPILYLWESDIINNPQCCVELIVKYIDSLNNHYDLPDYHSFNWSYDEQLKLNSEIVIPFQSQPIENYRKYFTTECVTTAVE